jgi:two-component system, NarL family, sensor histidine kinase DegS
LERLVDRLRKSTPIDIQLHLDGQAAALDPRAGVQVLNIVRETVSNALRHAEARRIDVRLEREDSMANDGVVRWVLSISDDGVGFDPKQVNGHGCGLKNLTSRTAELGGRSEIVSEPAKGTRVVVEFATAPRTPSPPKEGSGAPRTGACDPTKNR